MRAARNSELLQAQRVARYRAQQAAASAAPQSDVIPLGSASTEGGGDGRKWMWIGAAVLTAGLAAAAIGTAVAGRASTEDAKAAIRKRRAKRRAKTKASSAPPPALPLRSSTHAPKPAVSGGEMKGYKKTADGRTTSFFHNDLDETAQSLVGGDYTAHIAPKAVAVGATAEAAVNKTGVGSEWSDGSTWEDRDVTAALHARLAALVHPASVSVDGMVVRTTALKDVEGDGNIMISRGKTKRIYNLCCTVCWEATAVEADGAPSSSSSRVPVRGEITFVDINDDAEDVEIAWKMSKSGGARAVVEQAKALTKRADSALQCVLLERLAALRAEVLAM